MQQYQYTGSKTATVKPVTRVEPSVAESRLLDIVNRLTQQNELQARQIRRLESDLNLLKESVNRRST
jgi:hypothetical protein